MACNDNKRTYVASPINTGLEQLPNVPPLSDLGLKNFLLAVKAALEGQSSNPKRPGAILNFTSVQTDSGTQLVWDSEPNSAFYVLYRNNTNDFSLSRVVATVHAAGGIQRPGFFDVAGQAEVSTDRVYWIRGFGPTGEPGPLSSQALTVDNGVIPGDHPWTEVLTPGEVRLVEQNNADPVVIRSYGSVGPELRFFHDEGTEDNPEATESDDELGRISFGGTDGSTEVSAAYINAVATADISTGTGFVSSLTKLGGDGTGGSWAAANKRGVTGAAIIGDYILVTTYVEFPRSGTNTNKPTVYRYQISTATWTNVTPSLPSDTVFISNVVAVGSLFYYGTGVNNTAGSTSARLYSYDPASNTTTTLASSTSTTFDCVFHITVDEDNNVLYFGSSVSSSWNDVSKHEIGGSGVTRVIHQAAWNFGGANYTYPVWHSNGNLYISMTQTGIGADTSRVYRYTIVGGGYSLIGGSGSGSSLVTKPQYPVMIPFGPYLYVGTSDGEVWEWNEDTDFWTKIGGDGLNSSWTSTKSMCQGYLIYNDLLYWAVQDASNIASLWLFTPSSGGLIAGTWSNVQAAISSDYETYNVIVADPDTNLIYTGTGSTQGSDADFWGIGTAATSALALANLNVNLMLDGITDTTVTTWFANGDIGFGVGLDGMYWDESTRRLGIRTTTPTRALDVNGTQGIHIAQGSPGTPALGDLYIATTTGILTWHDGTAARRTAHAPAALTDNSLIRGDGGVTGLQTSGILVSDVDAITGVTLLGLEDTDGTHNLSLKWNENSSANHTLNLAGLTTSDRTLTFAGNATISNTNSGDVTLSGTPDYITISGQVITRGLIDLATDITGDLPYANLTPSASASKLLGRGSASAGDWQEITLGTGLSMSGTTLSAAGASINLAALGALDGDGSIGDPLTVVVDGTTIQINGSNQLIATGSGGTHATTHYDGGSDPVDILQLDGYDATATHFLDGSAHWDTVKDSDLSLSDITTNNVSTSQHGFTPKAPNDATKFLDGTAAWDTVKDSDLSTSDITTNDVTTSKHGFTPKAPNDTTKYLRGDATWAVPSGTGAWGLAGTTTATGTVSTGSWDYTSNITEVIFTGLGSYSEINVIIVGITLGTTGLRRLNVSTNGGSTWLTSSGDYINVDTVGVEANNTDLNFHGTNATAARSGAILIKNFNSADSKTKYALRENADTTAMIRIPTASALNAIRITGSGGGNITGGSIRVFGR